MDTVTHPGPCSGQSRSHTCCSWAGGCRCPSRPCGPSPDTALCPAPHQRRREGPGRGPVRCCASVSAPAAGPAPSAAPLLEGARHAAPACSAEGTVPREHGKADVNAGEPRGQFLEFFVSDKSVTNENWQWWPRLGTPCTAEDKPAQHCCPRGPPGSQTASGGLLRAPPASPLHSAAPQRPPPTWGQ